MSLFRQDPGPCIICGAPHCSCGGGPIEVVQLPLRDAAIAAAVATSTSDTRGGSSGQSTGRQGPEVGQGSAAHPASASAGALGDGSDDRPFSTATYRGKGRRRR